MSLYLLTYHLVNLVLERVIQHLRSGDEQLLNILAGECGGLETELDSAVCFELLDALFSDGSFVDLILLVADKEQDDIRFALRHHLVVPSCQVIECLQARHIVR